MNKAVIFDLDGTLVDTLQDLGEAVEFALRDCEVPLTHTMDEYRLFVGHGVQNLLSRAFAGSDADEKTMTRARAAFNQYYNAHSMDHAHVYNGMSELVQSLKKNGLRLAVLTNKPHMFAREMVERFFGKHLFDIIQGQTDELPKKPDPATALALAEKMGCAPDECAFVGDSETDMQTAVNAAMQPVGVLWGFRTRRDLEENGAVFIAESAEDLKGILCEKN